MNGYTSWNAWNVSLWLHNNENYYHIMNRAISLNPDVNDAARNILAWLTVNSPVTPDDAEWNVLDIIEAIEDEWAEHWEIET